MEVHHHAHPASGETHTSRKKWTHYFWEFLMLFLAVFCGFFAEYQLEHKIEKDREKQFMKSLLVDLQKDSSNLSNSLQVGPRIVWASDSLLAELQREPLRGREKRIYQYLSLLSEGVTFRYYDRTVSQLRNSGGFRLVSKHKVSDAILDYDVVMRDAVSYSTSTESWSFITPGVVKSASIFNIDLVFKIYEDARKFINPDSINFPGEVALLTYDKKDIKEFINLQRIAQLTDGAKLDYSQRAFALNRRLDSIIRKEYHLK